MIEAFNFFIINFTLIISIKLNLKYKIILCQLYENIILILLNLLFVFFLINNIPFKRLSNKSNMEFQNKYLIFHLNKLI